MTVANLALIQKSGVVPWSEALRRAGFEFRRFCDAAYYSASRGGFLPKAIVASDLGGTTTACIEGIARIASASPSAPIITIVSDSCEEAAITALKSGARDYLKMPVGAEQLLSAIRRVGAEENGGISGATPSAREWIAESVASRGVMVYASRLAATGSTVLITGETGTGKDLAAEFIHAMSSRRGRPFVALNCAALPDSLLESELFGRERGAYTGADTAYEGKLKSGDGGTVFFDEIGDLTPYGQAKILRVLENRCVQRLGSACDIPLNIRVIAATNQNLREMVEKGRFRRDLFYRLSVTRLDLPPLRERPEDIVALLNHFATGLAREWRVTFPGFSRSALDALTAYAWPGNVRELRNLVEELFVNLPRQPVELRDLRREIAGQPPRIPEPSDERSRILLALSSTQWNKKQAAARLRWSRMTLYRKMALHQITLPDRAEENVSCDSDCYAKAAGVAEGG